jgi:signal peptidase I
MNPLGTSARLTPAKKLQRVVLASLALLLLFAAARGLSIQGLIKPVRIASGSMAPALAGPRYEIACGDCGYLWAVDAGQALGDDMVVCPNCGFSRNELSPDSLQPGRRVWIDRGAYWLRRPRRFEAVAFRDPHDPQRLAVKRVIALPGESLEVRGGELFVDGNLVRKSLDQFRAMALPVYDDRFRPKDASLSSRWRDKTQRWTRSADSYHYAGDFQPSSQLRTNPDFAWLTYHHWRCSPLPGLRTKETPVLDDYGYNLGPSRQLNYVADLALRCRVATAGEGCLAVSLHDGYDTWQIRLWPRRGEASLWRDGEQFAAGAFPRRWDDGWILEAAHCDGRILAAIDGREAIVHACELPKREFHPSPQPFALGAAGLAVEASELVITRDVYYLPPPGRANWRIGPLGEDEFALLGDNASISQDSRSWTNPQIERSRIRGLVHRTAR